MFAVVFSANAQKKITFQSKDGLVITADQYIENDTLPYIILCHQANYSRGEYNETALKFNKLGYNCLAIDLRSGGEVNGVKNETYAAAVANGKGTSYLDAQQDIVAAINFLDVITDKQVILLGSSYSASLVMRVAVDNSKVKALLLFSPSDCFGGKVNFKESIKALDKPMFITSAKEESSDVLDLTKITASKNKTQFTPKGKGTHGAKVLWNSNVDYPEYWMAIVMFLKDLNS